MVVIWPFVAKIVHMHVPVEHNTTEIENDWQKKKPNERGKKASTLRLFNTA